MRQNNLIAMIIVTLSCFGAKASSLEMPDKAKALLKESYNVDINEIAEVEATSLRLDAVGKDAYSWGMQEGSYDRNEHIQRLLIANSFVLNKTFSLSKFIIDGKVLMPTILEAERIYVKNSEREARTVNMSYTLDKSPRIVSQIPTWRDYLIRKMKAPRKPLINAYPRNNAEKVIWDKEFMRGWYRGVEQANSIYQSDLNKLHAEAAGLYTFRFLLAQNIVTLPTLAKNKSSVMLLDSGKTINLNDVKYSITLDSRFNKVTDWKPVFNQGGAHE